jgi:hypothetical protein
MTKKAALGMTKVIDNQIFTCTSLQGVKPPPNYFNQWSRGAIEPNAFFRIY